MIKGEEGDDIDRLWVFVVRHEECWERYDGSQLSLHVLAGTVGLHQTNMIYNGEI